MRTRLLSPNRQRAIDYDDGDAAVTLLDLEHHITICRYRGYAPPGGELVPARRLCRHRQPV